MKKTRKQQRQLGIHNTYTVAINNGFKEIFIHFAIIPIYKTFEQRREKKILISIDIHTRGDFSFKSFCVNYHYSEH